MSKGLTAEEMESLGCRILLGNTYHLAYKPTGDLLETFGGDIFTLVLSVAKIHRTS